MLDTIGVPGFIITTLVLIALILLFRKIFKKNKQH